MRATSIHLCVLICGRNRAPSSRTRPPTLSALRFRRPTSSTSDGVGRVSRSIFKLTDYTARRRAQTIRAQQIRRSTATTLRTGRFHLCNLTDSLRSVRARAGSESFMQISISTPRSFNFKRTMISHGWSALLPFDFDQDSWTLARVLDLGSTPPVTVKITGTKRELRINISSRPSKAASEKVIRDVRHMFRLDDDMTVFYRAMAA